MDTLFFTSWDERRDAPSARDVWLQAQAAEKSVDWNIASGPCPLCRKTVRWRLADGVDPAQPNVREQVVCPECGCNARVRAAIAMVRDSLQSHSRPNVYVTEQATATYAWLQRNLQAQVHGSEFEVDARERQRLARYLHDLGGHGEIDFEDVTRLSFGDAAFDAVLSLDVLEHVPDYRAALSEFARVLKPGGSLIATFPFTDDAETVVRARLSVDGQVEHLLEPEYHGDPISGGVLCFYYFGWRLLDEARAAGFRSVRMVMPWTAEDPVFYGLWTLVAVR